MCIRDRLYTELKKVIKKTQHGGGGSKFGQKRSTERVNVTSPLFKIFFPHILLTKNVIHTKNIKMNWCNNITKQNADEPGKQLH